MEPGERDPLTRWTDPSQIEPTSIAGTVRFSCCGKAQSLTAAAIRHVSCGVCGTLYGVVLQVALASPDDYPFPSGTPVRVREGVVVRAGSTPISLEVGVTYLTTQDVHGVLNVPPGHQPLLVSVPGSRGPREMVAVVPGSILESVGDDVDALDAT